MAKNCYGCGLRLGSAKKVVAEFKRNDGYLSSYSDDKPQAKKLEYCGRCAPDYDWIVIRAPELYGPAKCTTGNWR